MEKELETEQFTRTGSGTSVGKIQHRKTKKSGIVLATTPLIALVLSLITLGGIWYLVPKESWAHVLFFERSWIQYANTFFFWIVIVSLVFRWLQHRHEVRACDVIEEELLKPAYKDMSWQNAFVLEDRLVEDEFRKHHLSLVFTRVTRALRRLTKTQSTAEMREYMRIRGEIDFEEMESSYAGIRYLTWLIPTLGFVGTVLGISEGISSCGNIVQVALIEHQGIPDISFALQALGTAFDTTFLALVYSAIAVFCTSFQTKEEEQVLERIDHLSIDEVCGKFQEHSTINDGLLRRLLDMEEKLIDNVHGDRAELSRVIREDLPLLLSKALGASFEKLKIDNTKDFENLIQGMNQAGEYLVGEMGNMHKKLSNSMDNVNKDVVQALGKVVKTMDEMLAHIKGLKKIDHDEQAGEEKIEDFLDTTPATTGTSQPHSSQKKNGDTDDSISEDDIRTEYLDD